ncbi:MAG: hypothetical protein ACJZ8M_11670 [Pseudohongiellaceae bacterium]
MCTRETLRIRLRHLASGGAYLEMIFDGNGRQTAAGPENTSSDMTPSGLPIDRSEPIYQETIRVGSLKLQRPANYISDSTAQFTWSLDYTVPANAPDGIYNSDSNWTRLVHESAG